MDDSGPMALNDRFDDLSEKRFGHTFGQSVAFRNEIIKIFARLHALQHENEHVAHVASIQQLDDARNVRYLTQQAILERYSDTIDLIQTHTKMNQLKFGLAIKIPSRKQLFKLA